MSGPTAYTPLESLLLFQALRSEGVHPGSFNRISDQLERIPLIRNDPTYDRGRLSPDALRELYRGLLKEEAKVDVERRINGDGSLITHADALPVNGDADVVQASRKRKAASPGLPTVHEATQHSHLIPQLVNRLYARYRDNAVRYIREQERRHLSITQEIAQIEAGQWDARLQELKKSSTAKSPRSSFQAHAHPVVNISDHSQSASPVAASPALQAKPVQSSTPAPPKQYSHATTDVAPHQDQGTSQEQMHEHRRAHSNATSPSPLAGIAPKMPSMAQTQAQHMPNVSNHMFGHSPSPGQLTPYANNRGRSAASGVPSAQVQQSLSRSSFSPRPALPAPTGVQFPSNVPIQSTPSPGVQNAHLPQHQHQQYSASPNRMSSGSAPVNNLVSREYPATPVPSQTSGYHQQQAYQGRRGSYTQPQAQQIASLPNQQAQPGGYMLPPFQITSQDSTRPINQQHLRPLQMPSQAYNSPLPHHLATNAPATAPRLAPQSRAVANIVSALATPMRQKVRPLWKTEARPSTGGKPKSQTRPDLEPLSPTQSRARSPALSAQADSRGQSALPSKARPGRRKRARSPQSVVSSAPDDSLVARTRSQSVSTVVDTGTIIEDRRGAKTRVKAEPSTPAASGPDDTEIMAAPVTTPAGRPVTRKRHGTAQSHAEPPSKKPRHETPMLLDEHELQLPSPPRPRNNKVIATRNLARMSSTVMNDIDSHKHASYFRAAVRDRDAPGYSEIVHHPQNLKSIRTAISAGSRAIAVATANSDSPSTVDGWTTVELERSAALEPPHAIVNGAQLEKEVMRMLANAWMFNPGEDGMAEITKEMFADVERQMNEWRGTERVVGGDENDESKGKRRKI